MSQDARPRILLLYNRNETTTASYLEAALRRTADVVTAGDRQQVHVARGTQLPIPRLLEHFGAPVDLVLEVEGDNVDAVGQEDVETPCAWWAIDSHLHMSYDHHFHRAGVFDHVFVAQKHHVYRYKEWAWTEASWLPLAADPDVFQPKDEPHVFDVGFVGNMLPGLHEGRRQLLKRIYKRFDRVGIHRGVWREEASRVIARSRLAFNRSLHEDVNMRVFEVLACGRPLLTDRLPEKCGLGELFDLERDLVLYDNASLEKTIERWLADPAGADEIGRTGRAHVLASHTYDHRAREILRVFGLQPSERELEATGTAVTQNSDRGGP